VESTPFVEGDTGLFVSKLTPGGPAERAGLRVGDKVLEVNGTAIAGQRHDVAVKCIQQSPDAVELVVSRGLGGGGKAPQPGREPIENGGHLSLALRLHPGRVTRPHNAYGFSLKQAKGGELLIASTESSSDLAKLGVGDQLLSINGQNIQTARLAEVSAMLEKAASGAGEIYVVVKKGSCLLNSSFAAEENGAVPMAGELSFGDRSLDGLVEVGLWVQHKGSGFK